MSRIRIKEKYDGDFKAVVVIGDNDDGCLLASGEFFVIGGKSQVAKCPDGEIDKNGKIGRLGYHFVHTCSGGSLQFVEHILGVGLTEKAENGDWEGFQNAFKLEPAQIVKIGMQLVANRAYERLDGNNDGNVEGHQDPCGTNISNGRYFFEKTQRKDSHGHDDYGPKAVINISIQFRHFVSQSVIDELR